MARNRQVILMQKILLVDDDEKFLSSTCRQLRRTGHAILTAGSGDAAMAVLNAQSVDLVITDILMPKQDGLQLILEIRRRWPQLSIIAISGGGFCEAGLYLDLSLKVGATRALEKPFSRDELLAQVREFLGESEPGTPATPAGHVRNNQQRN